MNAQFFEMLNVQLILSEVTACPDKSGDHSVTLKIICHGATVTSDKIT
jgi:hypothetical protein